MEGFKIDISLELHKFEAYLAKNNNLILSAKFGDGKSYFLQAFNEYAINYDFITLYPVNYVVSDNKDIIEYIKYDILSQLLIDCEVNNCPLDFNTFTGSLFTAENMQEILKPLIESMPAGKIIMGLISAGLNTAESYKKNNQQVDTYLQSFKNKRGSIYECDVITEMIRYILEQRKQRNRRETVLIIEDLDRLDPKHLFRILNILSSQMDRSYYANDPDKTDNKFGFDKTILVMDYPQTKHIFKHFYGDDSSFEGYMSKYSEAVPFYYSITKSAQNMLINKMSHDIDLDKSILLQSNKIRNAIGSLSVRDIKDIFLSDYNSFLIRDSVKGIFSSNQLTILAFYMYHLGMKSEDVASLWNTNGEVYEWMINLYALLILMHYNGAETFLLVDDMEGHNHFGIQNNKGTVVVQYLLGGPGTTIKSSKILDIIRNEVHYLSQVTLMQ